MNSYEEKKQRRIDYYNEKAERFEQESTRLSPVSYTHLDVYKRQVREYLRVYKQDGFF